MLNIVTRPWPKDVAQKLRDSGHSPLLARLYAARGILDDKEVRPALGDLLPFAALHNCPAAAVRLAEAIQQNERLLIVADYDADGATACAVGVRGLRAMGASVDFIVPNRFEYGYGLTPEIVQLAAGHSPDLIITVDNGIASNAGIEEANRRGIEVLVTDHHLPGAVLPDALIVNPNQPECAFPSKNLAGVGVMFYVLVALRAELRQRDWFNGKTEPNLAELLDLVALGTVADVVPLDANNRLLVSQGMSRMRRGLLQPGLQAMFAAAGRDPRKTTVYDLGFVLGPRLNAAGRIADMGLGIECLLTENKPTALRLARELERLNQERKHIEGGMQEQALALLDGIEVGEGYSLSLYDPSWHQGVVGLLASRLKERHHRPTFIFSDGGDGILKASGRSIPGLHLRDALDLVEKRQPGLLLKFGGHAAAAGLTLRVERLQDFTTTFESICQELLRPADLARIIETDGELAGTEYGFESVQAIQNGTWGQGFPAPSFHGLLKVQAQRLVGEKHLKLKVSTPDWTSDAMLFNQDQRLPEDIQAVYRLTINEWNGKHSLQLTLDHWEPAHD